MKKETSNPLKKLAVMLLIPAACFFLWAFSEPEYRVITVDSTVSQNDTTKVSGDSTASQVITDGKETVIMINNHSAIKNLKGRVSGITITPKDSTVNKDQKHFEFHSNGTTYTTCDPSPLYIVDGKEVSSIEGIDLHQIESISVLKNASAITLYEDKGKNGVVVITTKRGFVHDDNEIINVSLDAETEASDTIQANITALKNQQSGEIAHPLYIVGGKEFSSLSLNALDPNQIDRIEVLKNEAAVKIYGDKGKNGVVIITTKRK